MAPTIAREAWSEAADKALARALPNPAIRAIVASEVRTGRSRLWNCSAGKDRAYVVTRIDLHPTQLVIVAFEGSGMATFGPWFIERAHAHGIPVRAHVTDERVARLLRMRLKFRPAEMVLLAEREERQSEFRRQGQLAREHVVAVVHH